MNKNSAVLNDLAVLLRPLLREIGDYVGLPPGILGVAFIPKHGEHDFYFAEYVNNSINLDIAGSIKDSGHALGRGNPLSTLIFSSENGNLMIPKQMLNEASRCPDVIRVPIIALYGDINSIPSRVEGRVCRLPKSGNDLGDDLRDSAFLYFIGRDAVFDSWERAAQASGIIGLLVRSDIAIFEAILGIKRHQEQTLLRQCLPLRRGGHELALAELMEHTDVLRAKQERQWRSAEFRVRPAATNVFDRFSIELSSDHSHVQLCQIVLSKDPIGRMTLGVDQTKHQYGAIALTYLIAFSTLNVNAVEWPRLHDLVYPDFQCNTGCMHSSNELAFNEIQGMNSTDDLGRSKAKVDKLSRSIRRFNERWARSIGAEQRGFLIENSSVTHNRKKQRGGHHTTYRLSFPVTMNKMTRLIFQDFLRCHVSI